MKRLTITSLLSITVLILASMAIVSCVPGSSKGASGKNKRVFKSTIQVDASDDLLAACDIEITYKGKGGVDVTDTITTTSWETKIVNDSFPTEVGIVNYRLLMKPNPKFEGDRCMLDLLVTYNDSKEQHWVGRPIAIDDIASNKVAAYLEMKSGNLDIHNTSLDNQGYNFIRGHMLYPSHKVSLNDEGHFEIHHITFNSEASQELEPSKVTEQ